jgi:hypothetical protein
MQFRTVFLRTASNVFPIPHSSWTLCIAVSTFGDHWRNTLKENFWHDDEMRAQVHQLVQIPIPYSFSIIIEHVYH